MESSKLASVDFVSTTITGIKVSYIINIHTELKRRTKNLALDFFHSSSLELPNTAGINHINMDLEVLDILKVQASSVMFIVEEPKMSDTNN